MAKFHKRTTRICGYLPTSMSTSESTTTTGPVNRHAPTAVEKQRLQLERLLKDPAKPAYVPPPPKEKSIRPPREMMKNVQGSSAGAGSGEFHVYKASRRREYERLKLLDETAQKVCREILVRGSCLLTVKYLDRKSRRPNSNAGDGRSRKLQRRRRQRTVPNVRRRRESRKPRERRMKMAKTPTPEAQRAAEIQTRL